MYTTLAYVARITNEYNEYNIKAKVKNINRYFPSFIYDILIFKRA